MIFTSDEWKSLANHITSDQTIVMHGNECIVLFLTRYFMLWTYNSAKKQSATDITHFRQERSFLT